MVVAVVVEAVCGGGLLVVNIVMIGVRAKGLCGGGVKSSISSG